MVGKVNFHRPVEIQTKCLKPYNPDTLSQMQIILKNYEKLLSQIQKTITQTEQNIVKNVNQEKVAMSWQIGKIINEHLVKNDRADYGKKLFEQLGKDTAIAQSILYQMRKFHKAFPTLPKNDLSWSHYRSLASVKDVEVRKLLESEVVKNNLGAEELEHKVAKVKKITPKKSVPKKLKVTRGRLFTYELKKILKQVEDDRAWNQISRRSQLHPELVLGSPTFVDLGFNMFFELKTSLKVGEIVESKKLGEKFSLKKSNVKPAQMHTYKAYLERVVDGDTIHVVLDLGFKMQHREILRLAKINAPEAKTAEGKKSREELKKILKDVPFLIVKTNRTDIYGRYVADVFFDETGKETDPQKIADRGVYLSQLLLDRVLVEEY
jgi:endonuclease YncB( thermonuclease family)